MGLLKKDSYEKTVNSKGDVVFVPKVSQRTLDKISSPTLLAEKKALKQKLQEINNDMKASMRGAGSVTRSVDKKEAMKARVQDFKDMKKNRSLIINQLERLGVRVVPDSLNYSKIEYRESAIFEGGNDMFYTDEAIDTMRLNIFESERTGDISSNMKDYLLLTIESAIEDYNESVEEKATYAAMLEAASDEYVATKVFIYESFEAGEITEEQKDIMLDSLGSEEEYTDKAVKKELEKPVDDGVDEEVVKESGAEIIAGLASLYVEACHEGNEDLKKQIASKIEAVKAKMAGGKEAIGKKLSETKQKAKEAWEKLSQKEKDAAEMIRKRVSGGKASIEELKKTREEAKEKREELKALKKADKEETEKLESAIEHNIEPYFVGSASNDSLLSFQESAISTSAFASLTEEERNNFMSFFETVLD